MGIDVTFSQHDRLGSELPSLWGFEFSEDFSGEPYDISFLLREGLPSYASVVTGRLDHMCFFNGSESSFEMLTALIV